MAVSAIRVRLKSSLKYNLTGTLLYRHGVAMQRRFQVTKTVPMALQYSEIRFDETERVFSSKRVQEIVRALFVLKLSSYDTIVRNGLPIMTVGQRVLGKRLFDDVMRQTMYSHFVAGESYEDIRAKAEQLRAHGIGTMLYIPMEEDLSDDNTDLRNREPIFDRNAAVIHDCISKTVRGSKSQMRITAICSPISLKKLTDLLAPYEKCPDKPDHLSLKAFAKRLSNSTPSNSPIEGFTEEENTHLKNSLQRLDSLAKHAIRRNIRLVIDAEQTYLEGGIRHLILALQSKYNRWYPWVYGTYQCYRKDTLDRVVSDLQLMSNEGFHFGAKLVRGAYRVLEGERAEEMGYANPIHDSYEDTCRMYNDVLELVLAKVADTPAQVMVATHNEDSIRLATNRMAVLGIHKNGGGVTFGQIYGMCDQASFLLGHNGYEVYKSVPCGAVDTTLPYLARRAQENRDVMNRVARERALYWKEMSYRLTSPWRRAAVS